MAYYFTNRQKERKVMMKKLFVAVCCFVSVSVLAQNPVTNPDSLRQPNKTDSLDFTGHPIQNKIDSTTAPKENINNNRRDSLPMDDRKPRNPPKK